MKTAWRSEELEDVTAIKKQIGRGNDMEGCLPKQQKTTATVRKICAQRVPGQNNRGCESVVVTA